MDVPEPTTETGRATSSQNARKHGSCSRVLILPDESYDDWLDLLSRWEATYPSDYPLTADFVLKTALAEWQRIRCQRAFDNLQSYVVNPSVAEWQPHEQKKYDLSLRYLTAAERRFQREFRMLEQFYKAHGQPPEARRQTVAEQRAAERAAQEEEDQREAAQADFQHQNLLFQNGQTGQLSDGNGNVYPPPPGFVPQPIVPGVYPPNHPSNAPPPGYLTRKKRSR